MFVTRHNTQWASERMGAECSGGLRVLYAQHRRRPEEQVINIEDDDGYGITLSVRQAAEIIPALTMAVQRARK